MAHVKGYWSRIVLCYDENVLRRVAQEKRDVVGRWYEYVSEMLRRHYVSTRLLGPSHGSRFARMFYASWEYGWFQDYRRFLDELGVPYVYAEGPDVDNVTKDPMCDGPNVNPFQLVGIWRT